MLKVFETSGHILFEETQKYPQWAKWLVRLAMLITIAGWLLAFIADKEKPGLAIGLAVITPISILVIYLNSIIRLEKIVTSNGLYYKWKPWHKRFRVIQKEDISSFSYRKFPFMKFGSGWLPTYGWYHIASRGAGIQLFLKDNHKFFFSTNEKNLFEKALQNMISSNPKSRMSEF